MGGMAGHKHRRWRLSGKKAHIDSVKNDINVTPLVDVMLVLLIIFMLMTLVMGRGHEVKLPNARNYSEEKDKQQPVITVEHDGTLYVEKNKLGQIIPTPPTDNPDLMRNVEKQNASLLLEMQNQIETQWKSPVTIEAGGAMRVYLKASGSKGENDVTYEYVYPVLYHLNRVMNVPIVDIAIAKENR